MLLVEPARLHGAQQFARRHVAVIRHVAGDGDRSVLVGGFPFLHEVGDARQRQLVVPGGAEYAEQAFRRAPDIRPVLLVVDPGRLAVELELHDLLAQRLDVVAADRSRDHVRFRLLDFQQVRREVAGVLRHQQIVDDLAAGGLDLGLGRRRGRMAPDIIVGEQHPVLADAVHGVLHGGLGEIGAVAIPYEFDARAIFAGLARRGRVGVEIDRAVFRGDLGDGVGDAGMHRADQHRAVFTRDEALGHAAAGRRRRFGIGRDPFDLTAQHAAFGIDLVDRHLDAAQIVLSAIAVLAAGVAGQTELDRLRLRISAIVFPRTVEGGGARKRGSGGRAVHEAASGNQFRHGIPSLCSGCPLMRRASHQVNGVNGERSPCR